MKLKNIVSAVLAGVVAAGMCFSTAYAVGDGEATYCFDNDTKISDLTSYGSVKDTGMTLTLTKLETKNGNGALVVSEKVEAEIPNKFGGYYFTPEQFGLKDFQNCTIEMSVKLCENAENRYDNFSLFTDGMLWSNVPVTGLSTEEWTTVSMTVPDGATNTKLGFTIPTFKMHNGDILYIDDIVITKPDGTAVANVGDYELKAITAEDAASPLENILLTVLLVVIILAIVGGIGIIVSKSLRRFS